MGKTYPVGIVGEASYQTSIGRCSAGQRVHIVHEPDNPYDKLALAVVTADGLTIGYVARESWLRDAVHEEGSGCEAAIKEISSAGPGKLGIVLDVRLCDDDIAVRTFNRPSAAKADESKGWFARLLKL